MRKDGRRIKTADVQYQVLAHVLSTRNDAMNMIRVDVPSDPIQDFINKSRKEGKHYSHLSIYIASYIRTLAKYPYLNRFVINGRIYARNSVSIGMVVLKPGTAHGTFNKVAFELDDTLDDVQKKMDAYIDKNRETGDTNKTDELVKKLLSIPGLCRLAIGFFKFADKYGFLSKKVIDASPFHCSMTITNLASIGTNYIYHHIFNFGTTTMIMSIGKAVEMPKKINGEIVYKKCNPLGIVMDERVADGCEYSIAYQYMQRYLKDPSKLMIRPDEIVRDVD